MKPPKNPLLFVLLLFLVPTLQRGNQSRIAPAVRDARASQAALPRSAWERVRSFLVLCLLVFSGLAFATPTTPSSDFIDNKDGTVTHKTTGLTWMRCSMGQTWNNASKQCDGTAQRYTYDQALALKTTFAGKSDWRLPKQTELTSIVERETYNPAINTSLFPNSPSDWYWSASPVAISSYGAWMVAFYYGDGNWGYKNSSSFVRLVRAGQCFGDLRFSTPSSDFIDNQDGTVTHKCTGLVWQRCSVGQTWNGTSCTGTAKPYTYDQAIALKDSFAGNSDWRVPNANELHTIAEYGSFNPAINTSLFPNTPIDNYFWSASPVAGSSSGAWLVDFGDGYDNWDYKNNYHFVRLVRAGQCFGVLPSLGCNNAPKQNVVLFLHGMNSNPDTWKDIVSKYFSKYVLMKSCPVIDNGKIAGTAKANNQNTYCYRVKFGAFDAASNNKGLENAWDYGEKNNHASAGDYSSFNQLGDEVNLAVTAIRNAMPNARILLVGHSRGGLAARAFLQQPVTSENKNSIIGLITTGTPHKGSRLGRIYNYIDKDLLTFSRIREANDTAKNDWSVVDFLNGTTGVTGFKLDARRPVIGYLADNSSQIAALNKTINNLPDMQYATIAYTKVSLGDLSPVYGLFSDVGTVLTQLSDTAAIAIKDKTADNKPKPSSDYLGDGIVTVNSQFAVPNAKRKPYNLAIRHDKEPERSADIGAMICNLGFNWIKTCPPVSSLMNQTRAKTVAADIISHDYDLLTAKPTAQLWQDYLAIITDDSQTNQREQIAVALGLQLRKTDNKAFYQNAEQELIDSNNDILTSARIAKLLAEIATPSAFNILTEALLNPNCSAIQTAISNAIIKIADSLPEKPRLTELSAIIESAWLLPNNNQSQLNTLALALAKLGTAQGVQLLINSVEVVGAMPTTKKKAVTYKEQQANAAFNAIPEIINTDSEQVLSKAFARHKSNTAAFIAAGHGLVNLGSEKSAKQVLQRLNDLPANNLAVGQAWISQLSGKIDKSALQVINKSITQPKQKALKDLLHEVTE